MAAKTVELAIEAAFDSGKAAAGFDDIGDSAKGMASDVETAARSVDSSADKMGSVADAADNMGSSSAQAAGGLGDLGGALSAVPGPLGGVGAGMETLAPLVMGVTGATDLMTLAMNSNIVTTVKARASEIAHAVATKAIAVATKAYTAVQWALNAALEANPIGLIIVAVALLVAGIVIAYRKSETFRDVVDGAMAGAKAAVQTVIDIVKKVPDFIGDVIDKAGKLAPAFSIAKDLIVGYFDLIMAPIQAVLDLVDKVIDKVSHIHIPHIPGFGRVAADAAGAVTAGGTFPFSHTPDLRVNVNGGFVGNERQLAVTISNAVAAELRRQGLR